MSSPRRVISEDGTPARRALGRRTIMSGYALERHVRACVDANEVVFLDLRRDRYWRAPAAAAPSIAGLVNGGSGAAAPRLESLGLIRANTRAAAAASAGPKLRAMLALAGPARASISETLAFIWACMCATALLRSRRLDALFAMLAWRKQRSSGATSELARDAHLFDRLRVWWPAKRVCLFDSIALAFFLVGRGHRPDLVIGVRTSPFAAHCWVELNGAVIGDTFEQCVAFTPIARV